MEPGAPVAVAEGGSHPGVPLAAPLPLPVAPSPPPSPPPPPPQLGRPNVGDKSAAACTPCSTTDLFAHLLTLHFIGKGRLVNTNSSNPSTNIISHLSSIPGHVPFHFIQTHEFYYCASCHLPILHQPVHHEAEDTMYHLPCFHLAALPYSSAFNPNRTKLHPPNHTKILFLHATIKITEVISNTF